MGKWIVLEQCKTFSYRFIVFFNVIFLVIELPLLFFIFCLLLIIRSLWRNFLIIFFCFLFFFFRWFFWFLYFIFCFNLQKIYTFKNWMQSVVVLLASESTDWCMKRGRKNCINCCQIILTKNRSCNKYSLIELIQI